MLREGIELNSLHTRNVFAPTDSFGVCICIAFAFLVIRQGGTHYSSDTFAFKSDSPEEI